MRDENVSEEVLSGYASAPLLIEIKHLSERILDARHEHWREFGQRSLYQAPIIA